MPREFNKEQREPVLHQHYVLKCLAPDLYYKFLVSQMVLLLSQITRTPLSTSIAHTVHFQEL